MNRVVLLGMTGALSAASGLAAAGTAQAGEAPPVWTSVPVPGAAQVLGAVAVGPEGGWAVGWDQNDPDSDYFGPAAYRYQNGAWLPGKRGLPINTRLDGVDVTSAGAIAVGEEMRYLKDGEPAYYHLAARWDDKSWVKERVPQSNPTEYYSRLVDVDALPSGEAWAVGTSDAYDNDADRRGVLMHRTTAGRWEQITDPLITAAGDPDGVLALSPQDIWITGRRWGSTDAPSVLHYDGHQWTKAALPSLPEGTNDISDIIGTANDLWAVGATTSAGAQRPLALHFDGVNWTVVPTPVSEAVLRSLATICGRVFAAGYTTGGSPRFYALELTPSGGSPVPTPAQSATGLLASITSDPTGRLWTVGGQDQSHKPGANLPYAAHSQPLCTPSPPTTQTAAFVR
ncbi:hypothetical protein ACQPXM_11315 [Kribbella sp. CA-253562]|uniref:hypothetical protein n=1 Tax=Kribbella sp. CA-253562 TaxID=3239942 RepID=UPI003D904B56